MWQKLKNIFTWYLFGRYTVSATVDMSEATVLDKLEDLPEGFHDMIEDMEEACRKRHKDNGEGADEEGK